MSFINVHVYDGTPYDYNDSSEADTVGDRVDDHSFTDGEELDAAAFIAGLLAESKHFDVRVCLY